MSRFVAKKHHGTWVVWDRTNNKVVEPCKHEKKAKNLTRDYNKIERQTNTI